MLQLSKNSFCKLVLSFHCGDPRDQIQIGSVGIRSLFRKHMQFGAVVFDSQSKNRLDRSDIQASLNTGALLFVLIHSRQSNSSIHFMSLTVPPHLVDDNVDEQK